MPEGDPQLRWRFAHARIYFDLHDCWVGVYWKVETEETNRERLDVFICILPTLPINLMFLRGFLYEQWLRDRDRRKRQ